MNEFHKCEQYINGLTEDELYHLVNIIFPLWRKKNKNAHPTKSNIKRIYDDILHHRKTIKSGYMNTWLLEFAQYFDSYIVEYKVQQFLKNEK